MYLCECGEDIFIRVVVSRLTVPCQYDKESKLSIFDWACEEVKDLESPKYFCQNCGVQVPEIIAQIIENAKEDFV